MDERERPPAITRRQALALGVAGAATLGTGALLGTALGSRLGAPSGSSGGAWSEPEVIGSVDGVLDLDLTVDRAEVELGGATVSMLAYNGTVPGPTLHLHPGDRLRVHLRNRLDEPTNLHTHGLVVSAQGNADNPFVHIRPGATFDYEIDLPDDHPAGVFWYHPHLHGRVADQLFGGLSGAIVVDRDDWSDSAPRVVVVSDVTVAGGGVAAVTRAERMLGRTGELLLANGAVAPRLAATPGVTQRLLMINACASRYLDLRLAGLDARLRGRDSGPPMDEPIDRLLVVPGGRADVVVTAPSEPGDIVAVGYDRGRGMGMMAGGSTAAPDAVLLGLDPDTSAPGSAASAPAAAGTETPTPVAAAPRDLRTSPVDRIRTLTLSMGMQGMGTGMGFLIDGRAFDPDRVDQTVALGAVEEWTIRNTSSMDHPFHLHIWPMQTVRTEAGEPDGIDLRDVVDVPAGGSVVVRIAFDRFPGRTVYHCHVLDHEDLGMMGVIEAG